MNKIQLVLSDSDYVSLTQPWINEIIKDYFSIAFIEHNPIINKNDLFVTNCLNTKNLWYQKFIDQGHRLLVDNLWETPSKEEISQKFYLYNKNWFWYNESLWYRHLGYHNYTPSNTNIVKNGLLLMNLKKTHRDWLFEGLDLSKLLYSYVGAGVRIGNDIDINDSNWQRHFNPDWYNSTAFSIVAETTIWHRDPMFITEKTFKPIAFQHPFILLGQTGILKYLKSLGFETFENIFDESYDEEYKIDKRLKNVVDQINNYSHKNYDLLTVEKLKHNKELFFNEHLVKNRIIKEIVEPILEYAEA
jgi:hypothetical protein